jgi:hypothetical protein
MSRPKVALCFFGLVKNYGLVAGSVEQYVLAPLRREGYDYDVYIHTYDQVFTSNARNGERNVYINPRSIATFFPGARMRRDAPEIADRVRPLDFYLQNGDPWPDNPRVSMINYVRQLYSLLEVTKLWSPRAAEYRYVIYLRPDVRFTSPLTLLPNLQDNQIAIPAFHSFMGCNDRFAYGRAATMKAYGGRMNWLEAFFTNHHTRLHAERYLLLFLQAHNIKPVWIPLHFVRVRADGNENPADRALAGK